MKFKWDNKNTTLFLRLYRKHRCLWNQYDAEYLNCNVKNNAFLDIIEELNMPGLCIADCLRQLKLIGKKWKCEHRRSIQCSRDGIIHKSEIPWYNLVTEMWEEVIREEEISRSSLIEKNDSSRKQYKNCLRAIARSDTAVVQKRTKMRQRQTRFKNRAGLDINSQIQFVPCTNAVCYKEQNYNEKKKLQKKSESSPVMSDIVSNDSMAVPCAKERTLPRNSNDNNIITKEDNIRNIYDTIKRPNQSSVCLPCPWKNLDRELPSIYTVPCPNYFQPYYDNVNEHLCNPNDNKIVNDLIDSIIPCTNVFQEVQRSDDSIKPCYSPVCTYYNDSCYNPRYMEETEIKLQKNNFNENPTMVKCPPTNIIEDEDRDCGWHLQCTIVIPEMNQTQEPNGKIMKNNSCEIQTVNNVKQQGTSSDNTTVCTKEIQTVNDVKQKGILTNNAILCTKEIQYCQNNDMENETLKQKATSMIEDAAQLEQESLSKSVECFFQSEEKENKFIVDQMGTVNTDSDKLKVSEITQKSSTTLKLRSQLDESTLKIDNQDQETDIQNVSELEGYLAANSKSHSELVQEGTSVFDMDKNIEQSLLFAIEEEGICEACNPAGEKESDLESWFRKTYNSGLLNNDCLPCRLENQLNFQLSQLMKTFIDVMECTLRVAVKEEFDKKVSCECSSERRNSVELKNLQYSDQGVNAVDNYLRTINKIESEIQAVAEHQDKEISVTPTRREAETSSLSALPFYRHIGIQERAKIKLRNVNTQKTGNMEKASMSEPISTKSYMKKIAIEKRDLNLKDLNHEEKNSIRQEQHVLKSSENIPRISCEMYTEKVKKSRQPLRNNVSKNNWNGPEISIREKSRIFKECCNEELWEDFRCDENCKDKKRNGADSTNISSIIFTNYRRASTCETSQNVTNI